MLWEKMIRSGLDSEGSSRDHTRSFMNTIINIWVLQNPGKFSTMWSPGNFSSRSPFQLVDPPLRSPPRKIHFSLSTSPEQA
jgi:hypothetical protein